ncbi:reverse transcriptase domain-containing protein [Bradyrhizobium sp. 139]|uniref:reverse transcriptase domain-containing protein n=1 Tax=Bradyrhizobium sp. 139 TaxID=2782616 RepID=UPI001FFA7CA8|nr:reverse transcriptase domain-containing protein [Bradyrhizobium sp. 139]
MDPANLSTKRQRIAELARRKPETALFTLHHHIDLEWMQEAYELTRKDGALGIDGVTAKDYEANLQANLADLLERIKSGRYKAPPVRRTYIPKADGSQRPLGIPTFEDKVAQRAIVMVLEAVYEQDFLPCSHGFRPGRSAYEALRVLYGALTRQGQYWVLDVDIRKYFDTIPHHHLRAILDQRVTDGVIRRMIDKWLKAGVLEDGLLHLATEGTPQGGVISPLLSNIYLHHVLDDWFETEVKPRMAGPCTLVRFADEFVMTFKNHHDAKRCWKCWESGLNGTGSRSIPTRRASSTSDPSGQVARIQTATDHRSTSSASPTRGRRRRRARRWCGNARPRAGLPARCAPSTTGVGSIDTSRSGGSTPGCLRSS